MKDSCSCGMIVYTINNRVVTVYDITTGTEQRDIFDSASDAISYYEQIAIPCEINIDYEDYREL